MQHIRAIWKQAIELRSLIVGRIISRSEWDGKPVHKVCMAPMYGPYVYATWSRSILPSDSSHITTSQHALYADSPTIKPQSKQKNHHKRETTRKFHPIEISRTHNALVHMSFINLPIQDNTDHEKALFLPWRWQEFYSTRILYLMMMMMMMVEIQLYGWMCVCVCVSIRGLWVEVCLKSIKGFHLCWILKLVRLFLSIALEWWVVVYIRVLVGLYIWTACGMSSCSVGYSYSYSYSMVIEAGGHSMGGYGCRVL